MARETQPAERKPKDRDFIETREGFLFCVTGYLHPPEKYTAYIKYTPATAGRWRRRETAYRRELAYYHAHRVAETLDYLQAEHPHYVHYCPVRDMRFSMVPREQVQTYYRPEGRLAQILARADDPLEEEIARLVGAIQRSTGISPADLGVTGSVLLGIHDPSFSDIDLIVYGRENAGLLGAILCNLDILGISPLDEAYTDGWCQSVAQRFDLTCRQARWLISRQWKFASPALGRRVVSLHPTRSDAEIKEMYGDHLYRDLGMARLRATVANADDSIYLPAVYIVEGVEILEGPAVDVGEIYSNEGLFCQAVDVGRKVEARGKLENVDAGPRHRLVVGSSRRAGPEYLLPVGI